MKTDQKDIAIRQQGVQDNFVFNLNYLLELEKINQKKLSELTGVAESTISGYCSKSKPKLPNIEFLVLIQSIFNVSIDDLLNKRLNESTSSITFKNVNESDSKYYDKYLGAYHMYYFNTNSDYGVGYSLRGEINYGILFLSKSSNMAGYNNYRTTALFGLEPDRLRALFSSWKVNNYDAVSFIKAINEEVLGKEHVYIYEGTYNVLNRSLTIDLECHNKDRSLMIFKRPDSNKDYIGGLGSTNSLSRGGIQSPCMQYIGISKGMVECEDTVIANFLLLNDDANIELTTTYNVIDRLKEFVKDSSSLGSMLSSDEQDVIIKHQVDLVVKSLVKKSVSRFTKMSFDKEISWYKFIKKYNNDLRGS